MLAVDLDGTLLRSDGSVSDANRRALREARDAGLRVVVCTGRGWAECRKILRVIEQADPVVVAGGSIVAEPVSGATMHRFAMDESLVHRAVNAVVGDGHAALVLKDPHAAEFEYLVVRGTHGIELDPVTKWWFAEMNVRVRMVEHLHQDEHPEHTVRVGACAPSRRLKALAEALESAAAGRGVVHHFPAVVAPQHTREGDADGAMHVLELFDADATKWSGISYLSNQWNMPRERIAAIGDQINDESMIAGAGLGIAMGNAIPRIKDVAKRHTRTNDDDGVAHAVREILDGRW
jgi:hydroxymethylpyrimidine pyrophosphatase-like HAD family hydrolase